MVKYHWKSISTLLLGIYVTDTLNKYLLQLSRQHKCSMISEIYSSDEALPTLLNGTI